MKVILRDLRATDAKISYKWRNDPEVWKFTGTKPDRYITPEIEKHWIIGVLHEKNQKRFAICINENQQYIGNIQLTDINEVNAQFHIFIGDKQFWGKGIATNATKQLIKYAKEELKLNNIYLYVNPLNKAAIKVYEKIGFKKVSEDIIMNLVI
jgi:diamine N-acetyltransferase